jgi:hypothetical protein
VIRSIDFSARGSSVKESTQNDKTVVIAEC